MHLDKHGLPVQANGDANDQLQRCGMVVAALAIQNGCSHEVSSDSVEYACAKALGSTLQPVPGWFTRYVGGNTNNVSADQLISVLCAYVAMTATRQINNMFKTCIRRFGFAQNYKDGLNADAKSKIPDFMLLRALPLYFRVHPVGYPFLLIVDALLVLQALLACGPVFRDGSLIPRKRGPDDVDHNNTILTLAVCSARMPTPLSWLARKLFARYCPWNYGCVGDMKCAWPVDVYKPVYGSLRWYHRGEAGGNPEIAEMWKPICERFFQ